jgi:DNA-binding NarL/FixJ family response regulator
METLKKNKILWIDDDIHRMALKPYIDEFKDKGFDILGAENPDEIDKILAEQDHIQCIIIDVSMPHGEKIAYDEAKGGMRTGLIVLKKLILKRIVKVVFTIVDDMEMRKFCDENGIEYLKKQDYFTNTFVDKVKKILDEKH